MGGLNTYVYALSNPNYYTDPLGLIVYYNQSTGEYVGVHPNGEVYTQGTGYSGHGAGLNNGNDQSKPNIGVIPRGDWFVMDKYYTKNGSLYLVLIPEPNNSVWNTKRDPFSFLWHGPDPTKDATGQNSSKGCIVTKGNNSRKPIPLGETIRVY